MAFGPEGIQPGYAGQQLMAGRPNPNSNIGQHLLGGGLAALSGGLGAYGLRQGMMQQQADLKAQEAAQQQANKQNLPQAGPNAPQNQQPGQINYNQELLDLLSQLTSQRVDKMAGVMPAQPQQLFNQAVQASNSQTGSSQSPPSWLSEAPKFAFEQFLGGGAQYNPLAELGDIGQEGPAPDKPLWRQGANLLGKGLQAAAPLGAFLGPLGWLGGAAAGGLGYGLQQI